MSIEEIVSGISEKSNTDIDSASNGVDSILLREVTKIIGDVASVVFGFLVAIIIITVPLMVSFELCYICLPIFRQKFDEKFAAIKTDGVAKRTLEFTFRDAVRAVREAETKDTGKSALWVYFRIKCKSVVFIAFMVSLVIMGQGVMLDFIINVFSGIFDMIARALSSV